MNKSTNDTETKESRTSNINGKGGGLGILFIFLSASILITIVAIFENPVSRSLTRALTPRIELETAKQCESLLVQLRQLNLPTDFRDLTVQLREPLPSRKQIESVFSSCLKKNTSSSLTADLEIFSSDYEGKDGDTIVAQLSVFDKSNNKISELHAQWTTDEFTASASSNMLQSEPPSEPSSEPSHIEEARQGTPNPHIDPNSQGKTEIPTKNLDSQEPKSE